jgi:hypothetical protein
MHSPWCASTWQTQPGCPGPDTHRGSPGSAHPAHLATRMSAKHIIIIIIILIILIIIIIIIIIIIDTNLRPRPSRCLEP